MKKFTGKVPGYTKEFVICDRCGPSDEKIETLKIKGGDRSWNLATHEYFWRCSKCSDNDICVNCINK